MMSVKHIPSTVKWSKCFAREWSQRYLSRGVIRSPLLPGWTTNCQFLSPQYMTLWHWNMAPWARNVMPSLQSFSAGSWPSGWTTLQSDFDCFGLDGTDYVTSNGGTGPNWSGYHCCQVCSVRDWERWCGIQFSAFMHRDCQEILAE